MVVELDIVIQVANMQAMEVYILIMVIMVEYNFMEDNNLDSYCNFDNFQDMVDKVIMGNISNLMVVTTFLIFFLGYIFVSCVLKIYLNKIKLLLL